MKEYFSSSLEVALVLPLGVVANQLMKIEADLRLLNMKALDFMKAPDFASESPDGRRRGLIQARLEHINEALYSIGRLVSDIEQDIHPRSAAVTRTSAKELASSEANRKPRPDQDD